MSDNSNQFPILNQSINGQSLVYFDNAATTQKPQSVIDAVTKYYNRDNSNVHRSINILAERATNAYESARSKVAAYIGAESREIIFTSGATEGLNVIVQTFAKQNLGKGDIVVLPITEHHSNIVPWLQLQESIDFEIRYIPLNDSGELDMEVATALVSNAKASFLSFAHTSNTLGVVNPVSDLIALARSANAYVILDWAQGAAHGSIDVKALDVDFCVFSAHKMFGPTGIGALYGKREHLEAMPAWKGGGEMIKQVTTDSYTVNDVPYKFEAGTPHIAGAVGFGAAVDFISENTTIKKDEEILTRHLIKQLSELDFLTLFGSTDISKKIPLVSFTLMGVHPHDIADILSENGIMVRAGHHCAEPLHTELGVAATVRASLCFYNTAAEIDRMVEVLKTINKKFAE